ncbi:MAG TPA: efflux RND transporter periplasmic adaptor subunit [Kofleriaceae bacterium]|nr:efflux RND transporter periplasmic adaptor subunit [Kofleriaceae bacterium]
MSDQLSSDLASLRIDHDAPPSRRRLPRLALYAVLIAVAAAIVYFAVLPNVRSKFYKTEVTATEIALVSPAQASIELTSTGYVTPQIVSRAVAKAPGRVAEVRVKQSDQIKAGDVLLVLDTIDQQAAIASSRTRVATMRANAQTARANLAEVQQQLKRERDLSGQGVTPKATAEDLARRADALAAGVKAADAAARAAQAEVSALEVNLKSYTLVSPISGKIINRPPELGDFVGPAMSGVADTAGSIEIADFDSLAVETDVPEGRLHQVKLGQPCEIQLDAFPDRRIRGEVYEVVPRVNRSKATVVVKVKFVDSSEGALPDMSARVSFLSGKLDAEAMKEPPHLIVPGSAVTDRSGAKVVFVIEDGRLRMMPIQLGKPFGEGFEVVRGPGSGTRVVSQPGPDLVDGQQVKERTGG